MIFSCLSGLFSCFDNSHRKSSPQVQDKACCCSCTHHVPSTCIDKFAKASAVELPSPSLVQTPATSGSNHVFSTSSTTLAPSTTPSPKAKTSKLQPDALEPFKFAVPASKATTDDITSVESSNRILLSTTEHSTPTVEYTLPSHQSLVTSWRPPLSSVAASSSLQQTASQAPPPSQNVSNPVAASFAPPWPPSLPYSAPPTISTPLPMPVFPLSSPPRCRRCTTPGSLGFVKSTTSPNYNRPYYVCSACKSNKTKKLQGWITWDDEQGIMEGNQRCFCGLPSREDVKLRGGGAPERFWTCATGQCAY